MVSNPVGFEEVIGGEWVDEGWLWWIRVALRSKEFCACLIKAEGFCGTFSSAPDVETLSSAAAADTDHGGNTILRKQINSLIRCALRTSDAYKFERDEDVPDPH
ncbi:hypothetical protein Droror1_Dr00001873 [Drosera rotundifolia]